MYVCGYVWENYWGKQLRKWALLFILAIRWSLWWGSEFQNLSVWCVEVSLCMLRVLLSGSFWWDAVVTRCHGAGVGFLRINAVGSLSAWYQSSAAAALICLLWKRPPNAQHCFLNVRDVESDSQQGMFGWFIGRYMPIQMISKNVLTSIKISMNQDCSLAILELEKDKIYWMNNLMWMVCLSLL